MTGEFRRIAEQLRGGQRLSGMARNANSFAILMVYATACLAYFWMLPTRTFWLRWVKRGLIAVCAALMMYGTILSGSRKGALAMVLLYLLWIFFCYRRDLARKPALLVTVIFAAILLAGTIWGYVQTSDLGRRFDLAVDGYRRGGIAGGLGDARSSLYGDAMNMIKKNPVAGVGIGCFQLRSSTGLVAHSEYAEIAADTGLVGAGIYFSWYVVFWIRLGRIRKWAKNKDRVVWQTAGLTCAMFLVICAMNFGSWIYPSKTAFLFLGSFMGYSMMLSRSIRETQHTTAT
jgi:O-antigen ligase